MIPKVIHYCWFGGKAKPPLAEKCLASWKKYCPDFTVREWNEESISLETAPAYVRQAYQAGRWAFVSDYVRLLALVEEGGVYLDTDVELCKPLAPYLRHRAFAGLETADRVQTGLLACEPGFPLFREFLQHYDTAAFLLPDGTVDTTTNVELLTRLCRRYGLKSADCLQEVAGLTIYPTEVFCPVDFETKKLRRTRRTVAIHWFSGSWHTQEELDQLDRERRQKQEEKRSQLRYRLGTRLFGEKGYDKLKSILKRGR